MSYLDLPRIHFAGQFTTGPSTINNTTSNFDINTPLGPPGWNPGGPAYFKLKDCTVTSVIKPDTHSDPNDTLVGQHLISTDNWGDGRVPAKIVDLDPQQQLVSMLYGLQLQIGTGQNAVTVDFEPVWFQDYPETAAYQSLLVRPKWGENLTSDILSTLQQRSPEILSIKFVIGEPQFTGSTPGDKCFGSIYGTIGPAEANEPQNFVKGRLLRPVGSAKGLNFGPAIVQGRRLTLDLLNAIPPNYSNNDLGTLEVSFSVPKGPSHVLGQFDYSSAARTNNALVQDFCLNDLSDSDYQQLLNAPVRVSSNTGGAQFAEDDSGIYVNATPYVFRMEANSTAEVKLWAGRFGQPHQGIQIEINDATRRLPAFPPPAVGVAPNGKTLSFSPKAGTTDAQGNLTVMLDGGNPNNPRGYIDGQVYALSFKSNPPVKLPDREASLVFWCMTNLTNHQNGEAFSQLWNNMPGCTHL